jgi:hypothetical protein
MSVSKVLCLFALAGSSGCHGTAVNNPGVAAASTSGVATASTPSVAPRALLFAVADRPVRVARVVPHALERGERIDCTRAADWRPELITPVVSFVTTDILKPTERLRYVSIVDKDADVNVSRDVRIALHPGEFAMVIDPSVVILYDRTRASNFCLTVVEKDEILIKLDLADLFEEEHF